MFQVCKRWIIAGFLFVFSMPTTTLADSPLNEFLLKLESSGANTLIKSETEANGSISGLSRFNGGFGFDSSTLEGTERRWIWNSDYVALVERVGEGKWSLQNLLYPNSDIYKKAQDSGTTASYFFGGPLLRRIESLDPSFTIHESEDFVYEYKLLPDHPKYSVDPAWNSMAFRFDGNSKESRLQEIKFYEASGGPGSETVIEWVLTLEYPNDAIFPVELVAKGSVISGSIPGVRDEDLWKEIRVEFDKNAKFERSECYLTFYGLPEPKLSRKDKTWVWLLLASLLTIGAAVAVWKLYRK